MAALSIASIVARLQAARKVADLKPAEQRVFDNVLEALATAGDEPARPSVTAEDRRAVGAENVRRPQAIAANRQAAAAKRRQADEARAEGQRRYAQLSAEASELEDSASSYAAWRDEQARRLWEGRPALVDELISRVTQESFATKVDVATIPGAHWSRWGQAAGVLLGDDYVKSLRKEEPRKVDNYASVEARRKALREFAEEIRRTTERGTEWATDAELMAWFNRRYAALPQIEPIEAVIRRGDRPSPEAA